MKYCKKCQESKPKSEFYVNNPSIVECKECYRKRQREGYYNQKTKNKIYENIILLLQEEYNDILDNIISELGLSDSERDLI